VDVANCQALKFASFNYAVSNASGFFYAKNKNMTIKPFKSTELKESKVPAFVNGDDAASNKNLTSDLVAKAALRAVFRDRPSYFVKRVAESAADTK
jgi:hypothetical protein